jgi:hypothetical protein
MQRIRYILVHADLRGAAQSSLDTLMRTLPPQLLMSSLRQLLSRGSAAPEWLRTRLSTAMTALVQAPGGVDATLEAFLGAGAEANEKAQSMVAALLARVPAAVTSEAYVAAIGPQILALLRRAALVQQSAAAAAAGAAAGSVLASVAVARRVGALLTGRLAAVAPAATAEHLLCGILQPLALFLVPPAAAADSSTFTATIGTSPAGDAAARARIGGAVRSTAAAAVSSGSSGDATATDQWTQLVSEQELDTCISDLEGLLLETAPPPALIAAIMTAFSNLTTSSIDTNTSSSSTNSVIVPLFRLHCLCCASKSRLLQPSGALLQLLLQRLPAEQAARHLQTAIMPLQRHYNNNSSSSNSSSNKDTVWEAEFAAGSSGGAVLRVPNRTADATASASSSGSGRQQSASASSALLEMESLLGSSLAAGIDLDSLQVSCTFK